jgi:type VI secretion system protein ImpA
VLRQIEAQFERTKDVWLAVYLCRAGARSGQLPVVETGAQTLAGLFEQYWDTVHPTIDELGVPGRKGPCDSLAARAEFLLPLERTILFAHPRLGAWSGADLERFRSEGTEAEGYGMFRAALDELGEEPLREAMTRLEAIEDGFRRADQAFMANAGGEPSPNFGPTYETLGKIRRGLAAFLSSGGAAAAAEQEEVEAGGGGGGGTAASGGRLSGKVDSREDVIRALDAINDYYRRREPSSPVPLVLERAKAWVNMDFMSVLKDISPDGIDEATKVLMRRAAEDEESGY